MEKKKLKFKNKCIHHKKEDSQFFHDVQLLYQKVDMHTTKSIK